MPAPARDPRRPDWRSSAEGGTRMKILIVDADRSLVEAITIGLELHWGDVQVLSAADGETGLDLFYHEAPDLTLLDVNLPGTSGWEMLQRARAGSTAPVIILTARGRE